MTLTMPRPKSATRPSAVAGRIEQVEREAERLQAQADEMAATAAEAQARADEARVRHALGELDQRGLASAVTAAAKASAAAADAAANVRAAHVAIERLNADRAAAIEAQRQAEIADVRARYAQAVRELDAALQNACEANERVFQLHEEGKRWNDSAWGNSSAAGEFLAWAELTLRGQSAHPRLNGAASNPSKLSAWRQDAARYLKEN